MPRLRMSGAIPALSYMPSGEHESKTSTVMKFFYLLYAVPLSIKVKGKGSPYNRP
jgi:hypothetical protein